MLATAPVSATRYRPFARIGRGGMAEVFLASVRAPDASDVTKLVVLKRIWDELAADPDFLEMFLDEARLSARMSHPNVVQTYEVTDERGRMTMAMEYLHGQPLAKVLNRLGRSGDLTLALRLRIVIDILAGLDHAHELSDYDGTPLGVVHRDVSPQNVFITYDGHVKLVDFGVAKTLAGMHQTRPGAIKGKLAYMAPEQLCGPVVDRRADIFSVGVLLWEILAGRRLFQGMTEVTITHHLSFGAPVPEFKAELNLPEGLEQICLRALAPNPDDRFATAAEMEDELRRVLPAVTDSHARHLGKIVSLAFASERAERQQLIDRHLSAADAAVFDANDGDAADEGRTADTTPSIGKSLIWMPPSLADARAAPSTRRRARAPAVKVSRRYCWRPRR
ncbi:MAG: serine/threonine-protein kinase [Myxococcales bacterium]